MTTTQLSTIRYHGLGLTDMQVLTHLAEQGPLLMSELAAAIGVSTAAMTGTCRKLIGKLLIQRLRAQWTDGRCVIVELSELGRVRLHQITGKFPEPAAH